ncbi:MAG TPA: TIGR01906 family membrane protein [Candidatus Scybalocola faecavium]|nr:TIGR01906 family membrane protein [Candidatus Scybalocola faecavium]
MNEKKAGQTGIQVILGLILVFFIISFAVVFTLNFRPLYYFDIGHLNISQTSGYPENEIRENYDVLIDYNSIFGPDTLEFPTLAMSDSGRIHFEEVKVIFVAIQIACMITLILGAAGIIWQKKKKDWRFLKYASILTIAIPVILGILISMNWDQAFVTFHHIFFNNDYWIFDAATDPVITILPDTFFFHCAVMILGLVIAGSVVCFIIYRLLRSRSKSQRN